MTTIVSIDERAAGFIALGIAAEQKKPVALICTSGTAAYNFAPAVAEAYFQKVPLLVITADRPVEWIHQHDGQTIYQNNLFGKHVKKALEYPADTHHPDSTWYANRLANEAFLAAYTLPQGPVHLNVPVREPFYPAENERFLPTRSNRIIHSLPVVSTLSIADWHFLQETWEEKDRILIAAGQSAPSDELCEALHRMTDEWEIPVVGDVTANLGNNDAFVSLHDIFLSGDDLDDLRPDLLVTFGQSFLSKKLKTFFREHPPRQHWHVGTETDLIDTFQTLTLKIPTAPEFFFKKMFEDIDYKRFVEHQEDDGDAVYKQAWLKKERLATIAINEYLSNGTHLLVDLNVMQQIVSKIPAEAVLHLGNSLPVRHANLLKRLGLTQQVRANRGTSGIDGCVSTAIGSAFVLEKPVYLIVGDVSFLYDRNGFLIDNLPKNLKIVILNNGGGAIFRLIEGPRNQPELARFFETRHSFTAERTAADAGISYFSAADPLSFNDILIQFIDAPAAAILEVFTNPEENLNVSEQIRTTYKNLIG